MLNDKTKIAFFVQRLNPETDSNPCTKKYRININKGMTILDCLIQIKERIDSTLTFRRSCRSGICGSCSARVNGKSTLLCNVQAIDFIKNGQILIQPLRHFRIIKDLVVDIDEFIDSIRKIQPWLVYDYKIKPREKEFQVYPNDDFWTSEKINTCILCAVCHSDCLVFDNDESFVGPEAYLKSARFYFDSRDVLRDKRIQQLISLGILRCETPEKCQVECPKGLDIKGINRRMRSI